MIRLLTAVCLLGMMGPVAVDDAKPNPAVTKTNLAGHARHKLFLERNEDSKHAGEVIFLGDSITEGWEGQKAWEEFAVFKPVNLGISGDRTGGVLWRISDGGELAGLNLKAAVILIGTNNLAAGHKPEQIAAGIKAIIDELKSQRPEIKVLLLGLFPRGGGDRRGDAVGETKAVPAAKLLPGIKKINDIIAGYDDGKTVFYKDIGGVFLDPDGGLPASTMPDYLHLSGKGYELWAKAIKGDLEKLTK